MNLGRRAIALALLSCLTVAARPAAARPRPRLLVWITVDQLSAATLDRYRPLLRSGLARLLRRGAYFPGALQAQANTETAPGHANLSTGTWPAVHGVVGNTWFEPGSERRVSAVEDGEVGASTRRLRVPTLADALALATQGAARTVGLAGKARGAVLMTGRTPSLVGWYDAVSGRWVRGRVSTRGEWFEAAASRLAAPEVHGQRWDLERSELDYARLTGAADDEPFEVALPGLGRSFPRVLGQGLGPRSPEWLDAYPASPPALEALFTLAEAALEGEQLGADEHPDLLAIGISATDYAGHAWGPDSFEYLDLLLALDRRLGAFEEAVARRLGRGQVLWALSSDHGATPVPELARRRGVEAGRVDLERVARVVEEELRPAKGAALGRVLEVNAPRIFVSFEPQVSAEARLALARAAAARLRALPGIHAAVAAEDRGQLPAPLAEAFERGHHPGRAPALYLLAAPYFLVDVVGADGTGQGTGHGSPFLYDARVPLVLAGPGVAPGVDPTPVPVTRLVPTLAALLDVEPPPAAFDPPLPVIFARL